MNILLSARMTGQHARNAFVAFRASGILHSYHTRIAFIEGKFFSRLSSISLLRKIKRRMYPSDADGYLVSHWWDEAILLIIEKMPIKLFFSGYCSLKYQNRLFDKRVARYLQKHHKDITVIYGYEGTSYESFLVAKKYGIKCVYELPIGYWREKESINNELLENYPEWNRTINSIYETEETRWIKDEELKMADLIVVPSTFVKNTLMSFPGVLNNIKVVQYGAPAVKEHYERSEKKGKLNILYCGALSQRKGLADVFSVCYSLRRIVNLTVVGKGNIDGCKVLRDNLKKCNYIPSVSHENLLEIMRQQDLFFFPSYFEGFALVIFDSMSQGLPVITTEITSGPIKNGYDGWIVKPGKQDEMKQLIEYLYSNRQDVENCSVNALRTAEKYSWEKYQKNLVNILYNME